MPFNNPFAYSNQAIQNVNTAQQNLFNRQFQERQFQEQGRVQREREKVQRRTEERNARIEQRQQQTQALTKIKEQARLTKELAAGATQDRYGEFHNLAINRIGAPPELLRDPSEVAGMSPDEFKKYHRTIIQDTDDVLAMDAKAFETQILKEVEDQRAQIKKSELERKNQLKIQTESRAEARDIRKEGRALAGKKEFETFKSGKRPKIKTAESREIGSLISQAFGGRYDPLTGNYFGISDAEKAKSAVKAHEKASVLYSNNKDSMTFSGAVGLTLNPDALKIFRRNKKGGMTAGEAIEIASPDFNASTRLYRSKTDPNKFKVYVNGRYVDYVK